MLAKGRTVDYIDSKTGNCTGFYWGTPCNLEDRGSSQSLENRGGIASND